MGAKSTCSIIVRTKNEERWIASCLEAVFKQRYQDFEVILVDNDSTDRTVQKARQFPLTQVLNISTYTPGAALNRGIRGSQGEYIVCLSGHCIPTSREWLGSLVDALKESREYAGVYGRQEPMSFSTPADKRDLLLVFGLDRKIQSKDSFFHNANSIVRRSCWEESPFDEAVSNIEDRLWGREMLRRGYKLLYEPEASVYHYHGIHHDREVERCENVVRIIEEMNGKPLGRGMEVGTGEVLAMIPQRGGDALLGGESQLSFTIMAAKRSRHIDRIVVTTDSEETAAIAEQFGAEVPFLRPEDLAGSHVGTDAVVADALMRLEEEDTFPHLIVYLEPTFPFRPDDMIDSMIDHLLSTGVDTLLAGRRESGAIWHEDENGNYIRVDSGDVPRRFKERSFVGLKGLGCVTYPEVIRQGDFYGDEVAIFPVDDPMAWLEVRDEKGRRLVDGLPDLFRGGGR